MLRQSFRKKVVKEETVKEGKAKGQELTKEDVNSSGRIVKVLKEPNQKLKCFRIYVFYKLISKSVRDLPQSKKYIVKEQFSWKNLRVLNSYIFLLAKSFLCWNYVASSK